MGTAIKTPTFYGGEIKCILSEISIDALDKILDLMDEYIELSEVVEDGKSIFDSTNIC